MEITRKVKNNPKRFLGYVSSAHKIRFPSETYGDKGQNKEIMIPEKKTWQRYPKNLVRLFLGDRLDRV